MAFRSSLRAPVLPTPEGIAPMILRHFDTRANLPPRYHDYGNGLRSVVKELVSYFPRQAAS